LTNKNDVERINNKPEYKGQDFTRDTPLRRQYYKEHQTAYIDNLERAAKEQGTNASGSKAYGILETENGWDVYLKDVKHDANDVVMSVKVTYDNTGHIVSLSVVDPVVHTIDIFEFLEHHGVKGMHWGIRNKKPRKSQSGDFKTTHPLRRRNPSELTNRQLRLVNDRINLEQNYRRLNPSKVKVGSAVAKSVIASLTTAASLYSLSQSPAGKAAIALGKNFMKKRP
jgi:hypothetical protein